MSVRVEYVGGPLCGERAMVAGRGPRKDVPPPEIRPRVEVEVELGPPQQHTAIYAFSHVVGLLALGPVVAFYEYRGDE